jgi:predicted phage terminase large subunit-like protein
MPLPIGPQPGPQTAFLRTPADICIYGGAAGGGKSFALLLEPLRHVGNPHFTAVIFRRTYPMVTNEGGLWDSSAEIYPLVKAVPRQGDLEWRFPSGATVRFAHLQHEKNKLDWQGAQIPLIGFDELSHFSETQFWYMLSRNRSTCGIRPYVRATTNPDADAWVAGLIDWWINPDTGLPIPDRSGVVRYFIRLDNRLIWAADPAELRAKYGAKVEPKSLTFIGARIEDNPALLQVNPEYLANLLALSHVDQERLLHGNWKIRPEAGKVFNRAWFIILPAAPLGTGETIEECRGWDFAATAKKQKGNDPDFTAGVKIRRVGGRSIIRDSVADQVGPAAGDDIFVNTSLQDAAECRRLNLKYKIRWEQDPGQAAIKESRRLVELLQAAFGRLGLPLDAQGIPVQDDKLTRAASLASAAKVGNIALEAGGWNEDWLRHMHAIPDGPHDDIMDATATAYNALHNTAAVATAPAHITTVKDLGL